MSKYISVNNAYYFDNTSHPPKIKINKYRLNQNAKITSNNEFNSLCDELQNNFDATLPNDIDIFSELPEYVYANSDAKKFLIIMRKILLSYNISGITLSKLCISDHSDSGIVIDWIYNYFRVYFSFDSQNGNFYGLISNNPEKKSFFNEFKVMNSNEYETIARTVISFIITMMFS